MESIAQVISVDEDSISIDMAKEICMIQRRIEWIKAHASRYPADAVVYDGTKPFIREDVFEDLIRNRNNVDAGLDPVFKEGE